MTSPDLYGVRSLQPAAIGVARLAPWNSVALQLGTHYCSTSGSPHRAKRVDPRFADLIGTLPASLDALLACAPVNGGAVPNYGLAEGDIAKGVYLFSEGDAHLYVGRSNRLLARYKNHWMTSKSEREAAFAFKLARIDTGFTTPRYRRGAGSRRELALNPTFVEAFTRAKHRIRDMDYRWVLEPHPTTQCLLEIYVATVLGTPHNDFDNH
jgi:hypothetical protein